VVRAGTYAGFTVRRSGTQGDATVYMADPSGARPVIDGTVDGRVDVVKIDAAHDVRIEGFDVTGANGGAFAGSGIRTENGATRIVIVDNVIHGNHSYGINSYASTHVTIRGNDLSHNAQAIQIAHDGEGTQILDNLVHDQDQMVRNTPTSVNAHDDTGAVGIGFVRSTGNVLASGNRIWGNRAVSYDYGWDGSAFEIYGASNVTMTDNVAWDNENILETGTDKGGLACANNVFARNVDYAATTQGRSWGMFLRCALGMVVAHNTFHDVEGFVFSIGYDSANFSGAIDGLRVVDNIISMNGTGAKVFGLTSSLPGSVQIDYNLARTSGVYATLADGRSTRSANQFEQWTGYQAHGVSAAPGFVDAASHDYRLSADSPAVDAGIPVAGISDSWSGQAPDLGRYERLP